MDHCTRTLYTWITVTLAPLTETLFFTDEGRVTGDWQPEMLITFKAGCATPAKAGIHRCELREVFWMLPLACRR